MILLGSTLCLPSPDTVQELFSVARDAGIIPDISLDPVLTSFLSLDSSAALQHQYASIQRSMSEEQQAAFSLNLTAQLGGSSRVSYGGVGVVALALSVLFDLVAQQVRAQGSLVGQPSTHRSQAQRIFGISSSSRIGWITYSYLQQVPAITNNQEKMAETTELYDNFLKLELLDHYERMTNKKKRMSSESMRQWLAGAAVHLHMRIHQVRLHSVPSGSAESLRLSYQTGLTRLVQGFTAYLRRNIQETAAPGAPGPKASTASGPTPTTISVRSCGPSKTNMTSSSSRRADINPTGRCNHTNTTNSTTQTTRTCQTNGSSEVIGGNDELTMKRLNMSTDCGRHEEPASLGLLVVEPLRNVSHRVQHHPCESPTIEQALVTRIIDAQDLDRNRKFFLYSDNLFNRLRRQRDDFELRTK